MAQAERDSITRRSLISGSMALVVPAAAPAQTPATPDPIFAAIAQHRSAYADVVAVLNAEDEADRALRAARGGARRACKRRLAELCAEEGRLGRIEMDLIDNFVATVPQTLGGAAAALRYVREHFERGYPLCEEDSYMALLASTERAVCRAAGLAAQAEGRRAGLAEGVTRRD